MFQYKQKRILSIIIIITLIIIIIMSALYLLYTRYSNKTALLITGTSTVLIQYIVCIVIIK